VANAQLQERLSRLQVGWLVDALPVHQTMSMALTAGGRGYIYACIN
jgi:putative component of toxin-antitoxin plasmid stabilization module